MHGLIPDFPNDGVVTVNRGILREDYTIDDLQERVAMLCENVKTFHSDTGFVGGFVVLNSGEISNEGSTIGHRLRIRTCQYIALWTTSWNFTSVYPPEHG